MRRLLGASLIAMVTTFAGVTVASSPAAAALPDAHGFALYNGAATVPSGTWPAATTVAGGPAGIYHPGHRAQLPNCPTLPRSCRTRIATQPFDAY